MKKLAIDFGNSSFKIVGEGKKPLDLHYKTIKALATTDSEDTNHVVTINNQTVYFGVGSPLVSADKTERAFIAHSILLAAYEMYGQGNHEIKLGTGLPIHLYKVKGEEYKEQLESLGTITGKVGKDEVSVTLKSVDVFAECLAAFISLMPEIPKTNPIILVDIGLGTTDYIGCSVVGGKWKIDGSDSIDKGMYSCLDEVKKPVYKNTGIMLTVEQLEERILDKGIVKGTLIKEHYKAASDIVSDIFRRINIKFNDMAARDIYVLGGGAELFANVSKLENIKQIEVENKRIYSNAVGYFLQIED